MALSGMQCNTFILLHMCMIRCYAQPYQCKKISIQQTCLTEFAFRLDIGEILYAVNSIKCPKGRQLLWGWLQVGRLAIDSQFCPHCLSFVAKSNAADFCCNTK